VGREPERSPILWVSVSRGETLGGEDGSAAFGLGLKLVCAWALLSRVLLSLSGELCLLLLGDPGPLVFGPADPAGGLVRLTEGRAIDQVLARGRALLSMLGSGLLASELLLIVLLLIVLLLIALPWSVFSMRPDFSAFSESSD
jgi:hypothetical protein